MTTTTTTAARIFQNGPKQLQQKQKQNETLYQEVSAKSQIEEKKTPLVSLMKRSEDDVPHAPPDNHNKTTAKISNKTSPSFTKKSPMSSMAAHNRDMLQRILQLKKHQEEVFHVSDSNEDIDSGSSEQTPLLPATLPMTAIDTDESNQHDTSATVLQKNQTPLDTTYQSTNVYSKDDKENFGADGSSIDIEAQSSSSYGSIETENSKEALSREQSKDDERSTTFSGSDAGGGGHCKGWCQLKKHVENGDFLLGVSSEREPFESNWTTPTMMTTAKLKDHHHHFNTGVNSSSINDDDDSVVNRKCCHSRQSLRELAFKEFDTGMNYSIHQCLLAILLYVGVSIILFSVFLEKHWTIIDSCYFAVTTFTTLGYGDLAPSNSLSVIFTCIYAWLGVACLGSFLGVLGHNLLDKQEKMFRDSQAVCKHEVMTLFDDSSRSRGQSMGSMAMNDNSVSSILFPTPAVGFLKSTQARLSTSTRHLKSHFRLGRLIFSIALMLFLAFLIGHSSGWDYVTTLYFLIVTSCTIGYGDFTPTTQYEKLLAVIFIPLACGLTGHALGWIAHSIIERRSAQFRSQYESRELTQDDLDAMDVNGNGKVTRAEFLEFMLVAMNKIDFDLVDELHDYFDRLDTNGTGELSRDDLVEIARRKLRNPRRKLELAAYKRHLLEKAAVKRRRANILSVLSVFQSSRGGDAVCENEGENQPKRSIRELFKSFDSFLSTTSGDRDIGRSDECMGDTNVNDHIV